VAKNRAAKDLAAEHGAAADRVAADRVASGRAASGRAAAPKGGAAASQGGTVSPGPAAGGVLVVPVRVRPGAVNTRVGGGYQGRYGPAVVVAVNAPAVDGRATEMALRAVAAALGLRAADVTLRAGRTSRDKLFEVADPPADLAARIRALLDS
jgi:hypothetical protein